MSNNTVYEWPCFVATLSRTDVSYCWWINNALDSSFSTYFCSKQCETLDCSPWQIPCTEVNWMLHLHSADKINTSVTFLSNFFVHCLLLVQSSACLKPLCLFACRSISFKITPRWSCAHWWEPWPTSTTSASSAPIDCRWLRSSAVAKSCQVASRTLVPCVSGWQHRGPAAARLLLLRSALPLLHRQPIITLTPMINVCIEHLTSVCKMARFYFKIYKWLLLARSVCIASCDSVINWVVPWVCC